MKKENWFKTKEKQTKQNEKIKKKLVAVFAVYKFRNFTLNHRLSILKCATRGIFCLTLSSPIIDSKYRVSQKKTIHCLISCNAKSIKDISLKSKAFHSQSINLDFDI